MQALHIRICIVIKLHDLSLPQYSNLVCDLRIVSLTVQKGVLIS